MKKAPLLEELLKYHKEKNIILSMPGNKSGIGFLTDDLGKEFVNNLGYLDITEVDPLDNLHCPEGVIKEAQELLAKTYGVKKAYFVVNGSTAGNLASIFAAFNEGDEVLVERNCHKSIYNAIVLRKLKVIYIDPVMDEVNRLFLPPDREKIMEAMRKAKNPRGIILTSPNYYGISFDLQDVVVELKGRGLKIIIDGAHGAHYGVNDRLPKSVANLGDYVVISAHKTLPSLTQGAYLLVNDETDKIDFYIKAFMTTSPSYLIMASLDYGRYYLDTYGEVDYGALVERASLWKDKINQLNKVKILDQKSMKDNYYLDSTRYILVLPEGYSGHKLLDYLRVNKIQSEMSTESLVVLILSPFNDNNDFEKIYNAIDKLNLEKIKSNEKFIYEDIAPLKKLEPYEVFERAAVVVSIEESIGHIAKETITPYPPGIPLVCAGEVISRSAVDVIENYLANNRTVIGVNELTIKVIINE